MPVVNDAATQALRRRTLLAAALCAAVVLALLLVGTLLIQDRGAPVAQRVGRSTLTELPVSSGHGAVAGKPAYPFSATDLSGRRVRLADFAGKPLVVTFFASWCAPCAAEAPTLRQAALHYGGRVAVVSVASGDSPAAARRFADRYRWSWPVVADSRYVLARGFGVIGTPMTVVISSRGAVAAVLYGPVTSGQLGASLKTLLA